MVLATTIKCKVSVSVCNNMVLLIDKKFSDCELMFIDDDGQDLFSFNLHKCKLASVSKYFDALFIMQDKKSYKFGNVFPSSVLIALFEKIYQKKKPFIQIDKRCYDTECMTNYISALYYYQMPDLIIREYVTEFIESCQPVLHKSPLQLKLQDKFDLFYYYVKHNKFPFYDSLKYLHIHFKIKKCIKVPITLFGSIIIPINTDLLSENDGFCLQYENESQTTSQIVVKYVDRTYVCKHCYQEDEHQPINMSVRIIHPNTIETICYEGSLELSDGFNTFYNVINYELQKSEKDSRIILGNKLGSLMKNRCYYGYLIFQRKTEMINL